MPDSPDSVTDLLQAMVSYDTVNAGIAGPPGREQRLAEWLAQVAASWGLDTRWLPVPGYGGGDNLLITTPAQPGTPWVLFDSHLDTVATDGMTVAPLTGEVRDGRLWGRGACDTKGTGAAMLWAIKQAHEAGSLGNNVGLLFSVDEEVGMTGIQRFCDHDLAELAQQGMAWAGVVVGEPTMLSPITHHNGVARFDLTASGVAAHSSRPSEGSSAISAMLRLVDAIERRYVPTLAEGDAGPATCTVNTIHGGSAANIIPDQCSVVIDRRVVAGEDAAAVVDELHAVLASAGLPPGTDYVLTTHIAHPPMSGRASADWCALVGRVLSGLGLSDQGSGAAFATHGGFLDAAGVPSVVLGPGDIAQAHRKDEFITLDQLEQGVAVYRAVMETPVKTKSP